MRILALAFLLCLGTESSAQNEKPWYAPLKTKKFAVGLMVMGGMIALDHAQTARVLNKYPYFNDGSIFIGGPPHSAGKIARAGAFSFLINSGLYVAELAIIRNDPNKYWRAAGYMGQPAIVTAYSLHGFLSNRDLMSRCQKAELTC